MTKRKTSGSDWDPQHPSRNGEWGGYSGPPAERNPVKKKQQREKNSMEMEKTADTPMRKTKTASDRGQSLDGIRVIMNDHSKLAHR